MDTQPGGPCRLTKLLENENPPCWPHCDLSGTCPLGPFSFLVSVACLPAASGGFACSVSAGGEKSKQGLKATSAAAQTPFRDEAGRQPANNPQPPQGTSAPG